MGRRKMEVIGGGGWIDARRLKFIQCRTGVWKYARSLSPDPLPSTGLIFWTHGWTIHKKCWAEVWQPHRKSKYRHWIKSVFQTPCGFVAIALIAASPLLAIDRPPEASAEIARQRDAVRRYIADKRISLDLGTCMCVCAQLAVEREVERENVYIYIYIYV